MNQADNPFKSPNQSSPPSMRHAINWRAFWQLNIGLVILLVAIFLLAIFLGSSPNNGQEQPQLPRRYATYDHEFENHAYPLGGLVVASSIFAAANVVFFSVQILSQLPSVTNKQDP